MSIFIPVLLNKLYIRKVPRIVKRSLSPILLFATVLLILAYGSYWSVLRFAKQSIRFGLDTAEKVTLNTIDSKISTTDSFKVLFKLDKAEDNIFSYKNEVFEKMDDANISVVDYFSDTKFDSFFEYAGVTSAAANYILGTYYEITDFVSALKLPKFISRKIDNSINSINNNEYFIVANNASVALESINSLKETAFEGEVGAAKSILDEGFSALQSFFDLFNDISITSVFDIFTLALFEIVFSVVYQFFYFIFLNFIFPCILFFALIAFIFFARHIIYFIKLIIANKESPESVKKEFILGHKNKVLVSYNGVGGEIAVPDSVERINSFGFSYLMNSSNVIIPESVKKIEKFAFADCKGLETIVINPEIKIIPDYCFENCKKLKKVVLPESVEFIGKNAFKNCISLEDINLPEKIKVNKKNFDGCKRLIPMLENK